ncbi:MAG TPA: TonB family protein [Candidatus Acidoferrum sp.]|nr:TonB family protein [Candidatus Acidoferrum sp.]
MNRIAAGLAALTIASATIPALAQSSSDYSIAKVVKQGTTSQSIAGSGTVQVQVQVNADGTHKVVKILKSTNPGDNAAAMEIAQNSTYRPAHRGTTPITTFYDFNLRFNGKTVQTPEEQAISSGSSGGGGNTAAIDALVRAGKYKDAIAKANATLLSSPGDPGVLQLLGVAQYYDNDFTDAAATFSRVQDIKKPFQPIAAQAFATGAVRMSQSNPSQALDYANKAVSLSGGDATSKFALGVAQLANQQNAAAVATLKGVHDQLSTDPKADAKTKLNVDQELLQAYLANNDSAGADAIAAEMKQLDPSGASAASHALAQHYLKGGSDAMTAGDFPTAAKDFDQAAASATGQDAVTANTFAAFAVMREAKPDYGKAKGYAQKAVTGAPDDAQANFALGLAYYGSYASSNKADDKTQALTYLNKADQLAKAAGNEGLALQIEAQIKNLSH